MRRMSHWVVAGLAGLTLAWLIGFALFLHAARVAQPSIPDHADGIVALTGAPGRIDAALRLLAAGHADRLLVSGVATGATLEDIVNTLPDRKPSNLAALVSRTTLGHAATSTHGNAQEAAAWVRANNLRSLLVVTSDWHLPRAMAELSRALPGLLLYPVPVPSEPDHEPTASVAGWRLLASEYTKWLVVASGLNLAHLDRPRPPLRSTGLCPPNFRQPHAHPQVGEIGAMWKHPRLGWHT